MNKRTALAGAGALTMTAVVGAMALATSFGLAGVTEHPDAIGNTSPADQVQAEPVPTPIVETIFVDVPAPLPKSAPQAVVEQPPAAPAASEQPSDQAVPAGSYEGPEDYESDDHEIEDPEDAEDDHTEIEHEDDD